MHVDENLMCSFKILKTSVVNEKASQNNVVPAK